MTVLDNEKPKALLLFSGGFDSTVLLHDLIEDDYDVTLLFFDYDQRNGYQESAAVGYWQRKLGLQVVHITLPRIYWSNSGLHKGGDGDTYLEMRNLIFLSYALSIAESREIPQIFTGFIDGRSPEAYKDSSPQFTKLFDALADNICGIAVEAPFIDMTKDQVHDHAKHCLDLDMGDILTHVISCNVPINGKPCGACNDCQALAQYSSELLR